MLLHIAPDIQAAKSAKSRCGVYGVGSFEVHARMVYNELVVGFYYYY